MVGLFCFLYNWEFLLVFFLGWWWGFWWMFVMNRSSLYCGRIRIESLSGILRLSTILLCPKGECPVSSGGAFIIIVYDFDFGLLRYFLCLWFPPDVFVAVEETKRKFNEHIFNLSKFDGCDERERELRNRKHCRADQVIMDDINSIHYVCNMMRCRYI